MVGFFFFFLNLKQNTGISEEGFIHIASTCPMLSSLYLDCCGRMTNDALEIISQQCSLLKRARLNGCFLITDATWANFISNHNFLEYFEASCSANVGVKTLTAFQNNSSTLSQTLERLSLSCCVSLTDSLLSCLHSFTKLTHLTLSECHLLTDIGLVSLLESVGKELVELDISDLPHITEVTIAAIAINCPKLTSLSAANCAQAITDKSIDMLSSKCTQLQKVNFKQCIQLTDTGVISLITNCRDLVVVSLNSIHKLSPIAFAAIASDTQLATQVHEEIVNNMTTQDVAASRPDPPVLPSQPLKSLVQLDLSWCRQLDDTSIKSILDSCPKLNTISIWGCNRVTECAFSLQQKGSLKIIGAPYEVVL